MIASKPGVAPGTLGMYHYMRAFKVLQGFDSRHLAACAARRFRESLFAPYSHKVTVLYSTSRLLHACYVY